MKFFLKFNKLRFQNYFNKLTVPTTKWSATSFLLQEGLKICFWFKYRSRILWEAELHLEVHGEDGLHAVVGEPLAELAGYDEEDTPRVAQLRNKDYNWMHF